MTTARVWTNRAITGAMLIGSAILLVAAVKRRFAPPAVEPPIDIVSDWRSYALRGGEVGDSAGRVTIIEFADFQCPFCRVLAFRLDSLRARHPGTISVLYRNYPLRSIHPYAYKAAVAAECAGLQGQFAAYYHALFGAQVHIGEIPWDTLARKVGVADLTAFARCVAGDRTAGIIGEDITAAHHLGVNATPAVLVGDKYISGAPSLGQLEQLIRNDNASGRE